MKLRKVLAGVAVAGLLMGAQNVWADNLGINGSTTVLPIGQKVAEAYMKENPEVRISISGGGSGNGIKAIIDGTTDIGMSSRFIRDSEVKLAVERGAYPVPFAVAYDCIVPVVNPANGVSDISLEQLKAIYEGKTTNWKELGGVNREIAVISRDTSSGTYEVWNEKVLLGAMSLPVVIGSTEEALRAVPDTYREASLGLGATKWQTIYRVVLPAARPGILTGAILGLSRAAGETAPIMFTAAVFFTPLLPRSILDPVMALPYHIYVLATAGTEIETTRPLQYGTALVLIALVLGLNLVAIIYRARLRKRV